MEDQLLIFLKNMDQSYKIYSWIHEDKEDALMKLRKLYLKK